jgi:hypothetical protein
MQLAVGDLFRLRRIVALPDDRDLIAAGVEVPVDAVIGHVGDAVLEPADRDVLGTEMGVLDPGRGLEPVNALGLLGPEGLRVPDRGLVLGEVARVVQIGAVAPLGRHIVDGFIRLNSQAAHGPNLMRFQLYWIGTLVLLILQGPTIQRKPGSLL